MLCEWRHTHCKDVGSTVKTEPENTFGLGYKFREMRMLSARITFSQHRFDLWFAARMLSKYVSFPTDGATRSIRKAHARCVNGFSVVPYEDYKLTLYCDSGWTKDIVGRRSRSSRLVGAEVWWDTFCERGDCVSSLAHVVCHSSRPFIFFAQLSLQCASLDFVLKTFWL